MPKKEKPQGNYTRTFALPTSTFTILFSTFYIFITFNLIVIWHDTSKSCNVCSKPTIKILQHTTGLTIKLLEQPWSLSIPRENIGKPNVFWCFQGVPKETSNLPWVNHKNSRLISKNPELITKIYGLHDTLVQTMAMKIFFQQKYLTML